jgi:hypothetical protein
MDLLSAGMESCVESELVDLSTVSMTTLRELDGTVFRQALRHVMQQAARPRVTAENGSGQRDD